jgi:hypothetical protein
MMRSRRRGGLRLGPRLRWYQRRFNRPLTWHWWEWLAVTVCLALGMGLATALGHWTTGCGSLGQGFLLGVGAVGIPAAVAGLAVLWWRLIRFLFRDGIAYLDRDLSREEPPDDELTRRNARRST